MRQILGRVKVRGSRVQAQSSPHVKFCESCKKQLRAAPAGAAKIFKKELQLEELQDPQGARELRRKFEIFLNL